MNVGIWSELDMTMLVKRSKIGWRQFSSIPWILSVLKKVITTLVYGVLFKVANLDLWNDPIPWITSAQSIHILEEFIKDKLS